MVRRVRKDSKVMWILKSLLTAYLITVILLVILAMLLYKFELNEKIVSAAIVVIYVLSTFAGGFIIGKLVGVRKFLWGLGVGVLYFALLVLITLGVYKTVNSDSVNLLTTLILCAGGGMTGGMLS